MAIQWSALDYSRHAIREIYINGMRVPPPEIQTAEVHQCEYRHDQLIFQMVWPDVRSLSAASGWLVQMRWGADVAQNSFYGYVQSPSIVQNRNGRLGNDSVVQFGCLGATSTMQNGAGRNFAGMSADNVVKSIVGPYHLAVVVDHSDYLFPNLVQARTTDWQFLVELARRVGFVLTSNKVTVFFIDPLKIVQNTGFAVGVKSVGSGSSNPNIINGAFVVGTKSNAADFTNRVVQSLDVMGVAVQGSGSYDPRQSLLGAFTVNPTTTRYAQDNVPIDSKHSQVVASSGNRPEMWPMQTTLACKGDARLRPGVLASVDIGNNDISGLWITRSVVHYLGRDSYTMDVQAARDATTNSPYPTPTITIGDRSGPFNTVAAPIITNGKWTSIWSA